MTTTITTTERAVLDTFAIDAENAQYIIEDPVSVCTDVEELASATGKTVRSTKGVVGSLTKKGLLTTCPAGETGNDTAIIPTPAAVELMTNPADRITVAKPGKARGINKRTAPMTMTKKTRAQRNQEKGKKAPTKRTAATKDKAPKAKAGNTFTTVDLAAQHGINAKTLRARIRRNIDLWSPLFQDGEKHIFADNARTRKAIAALLDA